MGFHRVVLLRRSSEQPKCLSEILRCAYPLFVDPSQLELRLDMTLIGSSRKGFEGTQVIMQARARPRNST